VKRFDLIDFRSATNWRRRSEEGGREGKAGAHWGVDFAWGLGCGLLGMLLCCACLLHSSASVELSSRGSGARGQPTSREEFQNLKLGTPHTRSYDCLRKPFKT
jgi:hypothetical protein